MKIIFEKLDPMLHDRNDFDCSEPLLNEYLIEKANKEQKQKVTTVYIARPFQGDLTNKILGYYTLTACALKFLDLPLDLPLDLAKKLPKYPYIPTILIGRLARNNRYTKNGFGAELLRDALFRILLQSDQIGVFGIEVKAKNEIIKNFYTKFGFKSLCDDPLHLLLSIKELKSSFS